MPVKHAFVSAIPQGSDPTKVRTNDWNANHVVSLAVTSTSTNLSVTTAHELILATGGAGGITLNLYTAVGNGGSVLRIKRVDAGAGDVTIDANGSETIDGSLTYLLINQYQFVTLCSDGANWQVIGQG